VQKLGVFPTAHAIAMGDKEYHGAVNIAATMKARYNAWQHRVSSELRLQIYEMLEYVDGCMLLLHRFRTAGRCDFKQFLCLSEFFVCVRSAPRFLCVRDSENGWVFETYVVVFFLTRDCKQGW
jgi:hypothetical protein